MKTAHAFLLWFATATTVLAAVDPAQLAAARSLYEARKTSEAQQAFEKIVAADPQCGEAHYFLAHLALDRNDAKAAVASAEKCVALAPDNADVQHTLGDAYGISAKQAGIFSGFGFAKKCLAAFLRAVALAPDRVEFHQSLFDYYQQAPGFVGGGADKAKAEAAVILKLDPLRGHSDYAALAVAAKQFDQAFAHAAEIKRLDAAQGRAAFVAIYAATKEYDKALAQLEEVLAATPDDYSGLYMIGRFAATTGQCLDRGLAALRRCLEHTPPPPPAALNHDVVQVRIGHILEKKHDPAGARVAYEAALKLNPTSTSAADALKKLK